MSPPQDTALSLVLAQAITDYHSTNTPAPKGPGLLDRGKYRPCCKQRSSFLNRARLTLSLSEVKQKRVRQKSLTCHSCISPGDHGPDGLDAMLTPEEMAPISSSPWPLSLSVNPRRRFVFSPLFYCALHVLGFGLCCWQQLERFAKSAFRERPSSVRGLGTYFQHSSPKTQSFPVLPEKWPWLTVPRDHSVLKSVT
jgi:hypothetical protein